MKKISCLLVVLLGALLFFSLFSCGKCEHEWKDATCTTAKTCTKCGITEGEPLGHTYGDWIVDREATETEAGAKHRICSACEKREIAEIPMLAHTHKYASEWSYDDAYHWHDSTCGHDPAGKTAHTYGDWIVDREATETEVGAKHRICSVCGKVETAEKNSRIHTSIRPSGRMTTLIIGTRRPADMTTLLPIRRPMTSAILEFASAERERQTLP